MKFAICNELFQGWAPKRVIEFVAGLGYDGLEVAPFTLADTVDEISPAQRRDFRSMATEAGLVIAGLHWLLVKPEGLHLAHPEPQIRHRTVDYLRRLIDLCGDLGGQVMVFGSPKQRSTVPGAQRTDTWKWAVESFAACGDAAASRGVTLCLEPLPADLTDLLNTAAETRAMVREIGHPAVQMMLDVKSMSTEAQAIPQTIRDSRGFYRHLHANDANGRGPGFGEVDFRPILATLAEEMFEGFVSVEVFDFAPDPETVARESLRNLKAALSA